MIQASSPGKTNWLVWALIALGLWYVFKPNGAGITLKAGQNYFIYTGASIPATTYFSEIWEGIITAHYYDGAWFPITSTHAIQNGWHIALNVIAACAGCVLPNAKAWNQ